MLFKISASMCLNDGRLAQMVKDRTVDLSHTVIRYDFKYLDQANVHENEW